MIKTYFTSDTHFGHGNILSFCADTRPGCRNIDHHDRRIIENWQAVVQPDDHVFHLGDFGFANEDRLENVLAQLPGQKHFIWGNHDQVFAKGTKLLRHFVSVDHYKELSIDREKVVLFHFPIHEWNKMHHGVFHFYGHVHGTVQIEGRAWDVGVDTRPAKDLSLWPWEELKALMLKREIRTHHGQSVKTLRDAADMERYLKSPSQRVRG